ncbi:hypothetical protein AX15_001206 [Amanita polypyramis BW_CC]|nr:hypothetical protein AX15_001206 [Amanita polypyramis BW_CC]
MTLRRLSLTVTRGHRLKDQIWWIFSATGFKGLRKAFEAIWRSNELPESYLSQVSLTGNPDTVVNSSFRLGAAAQASMALYGLSAVYLHSVRSGVQQNVTVDARHAVLAFHGEHWYKVNGQYPEKGLWDRRGGIHKTKDDNYVRLHINFPHHRRGILSILNLPDEPGVTREEVAEATRQWNSVDLETKGVSMGVCIGAMRSFEEWDRHPQAQSLLGVPPVTIHKIGEAPRRKVGPSTRPLDGMRVLDLTRAIAGPTAARTLASHGADTLLVTSPNLPSLAYLDPETTLGKRTTQLDLADEKDRTSLRQLIQDCDVFLQTYRPGGLEEKGFGVKELAKQKPGIVCANLTAWGYDGPWKGRKGFDSVLQTATGFNYEEGTAYQDYLSSRSEAGSFSPRPFPMQSMDYAAGCFLTYGINVALAKTITEGGSWEVRVSLAAVGQWIRTFGRRSPEEAFGEGSTPLPSREDEEITKLSVTWPAVDGKNSVTSLCHAAIFSKTPVKEGESSEAPLVLNAHPASWL